MCFQRRRFLLAMAGLMGTSVGLGEKGPEYVQAAPVKGTFTSDDLNGNLSEWHIFYDQGQSKGLVEQVDDPSLSGSALKATLLSGDPYAGIHVYRNLPPRDECQLLQLDVAFYFRDLRPIQALEFSMNKWMGDLRWEWALQWEQVGDGTAEQGIPPAWRVWTGDTWKNTGIQQYLKPNVWHQLSMVGVITDGKVQYLRFNCDRYAYSLQKHIFVPVVSPGSKLAVGFQLNGDYQEDAYSVYYDNVHLGIC